MLHRIFGGISWEAVATTTQMDGVDEREHPTEPKVINGGMII
jgi:hypothetical protein